MGMKRVMLIGENGAGKSALISALTGDSIRSHKAMAVEYVGRFINTPGEFLENRRFYRALITTSAECDTLLLVQNATRNTSLFPPQFATMFNRRIIGVISDAMAENAHPEKAERFLQSAGAAECIRVNVASGEGLEALQGLL